MSNRPLGLALTCGPSPTMLDGAMLRANAKLFVVPLDVRRRQSWKNRRGDAK
ncbi:MAG: hypothetical protein ACKVT0_10665 [Planctomycetaceae bacterium]